MKRVFVVFCALALFGTSAIAQKNLLTAGFAYSHKTGSGATNGFEASGEYGVNKYFRLVGEVSPYWGSSVAGTVKTVTKSQDYMFGPRFDIPKAFRLGKLIPFGQLLYGVSHISANTRAVNGATLASDSSTTWAWDLGGGVEYLVRPSWKLRGHVSLFKTHFADQSQTNAKFVFGAAYCFRGGCKPAQ